VRIVAVDTTTLVVTSLHPRSEKNFAFDSVGATDQWEAHAMERSRRLPPGTYDIKVQWRVVGAATFRLDDWHFTVETFR
jgi:hypothetical protein